MNLEQPKKSRKLNLNKETLRSMTDSQTAKVYAGISGSACGIETCFIICRGSIVC